MNKNAKKSLLTLITILTLITPSSHKKANDEEEIPFASKFYVNDKLIEKIQNDYFYIKDEEIEEVLKILNDRLKGIYYNESSQLDEEQSVNVYKKISLQNETIKIEIESDSFKLEIETIENEKNKVTESFRKFPIFERAIDYISIYATITEDQFGNTLTKERYESLDQQKKSYDLNLKCKYGDFNISINQTEIGDKTLYYIMLNNEVDSIYNIDEHYYEVIIDYFNHNLNQADFAIMLNDINNFINKTKNNIGRTI